MKIITKLFVSALFILNCLGANGQERIISAQELHDDLDSLYAGINDIHPDMFAVISKKDFEKEIKQIKMQINRPMTATEFYVLVAPLIVKMRDGHTELQFPPWAMGENGKKVFPLLVEAPNKSTLQVTKVYLDKTDIPVGAIIESINKISAKKLIAKTMEYINGELYFYRLGQIPSFLHKVLWACYPWEKFDIEYSYEGKTHATTIDGISLEKRHNDSKSTEADHANYSFKVTDNIGIIDFRWFLDMEAFTKFIDSTFSVLKERDIKNLVIDIRNNGGGNSALGDTLFQFISPVAYNQYGKNIVKYSQQRIDFYKEFRKILFSYLSDSSFEKMLYKEPVGTIKTDPEPELIALLPNPLRYEGNVYLLISHSTFSSAADFAWAFKYFKMGKIIGEETGGLAVCFGDIIYQQLPNSKLPYGVSYTKFNNYGTTNEDSKHGIIPNYKVKADKAMDFAIDLIKQKL